MCTSSSQTILSTGGGGCVKSNKFKSNKLQLLVKGVNYGVKFYILGSSMGSSFLSGVKHGVKFYMLGSSMGSSFISGVKYGVEFYI